VRTPLADGSLVHVYRSPGAGRRPTPLLVVFDGQRLLATDVGATFDNLAADGAAALLLAARRPSAFGSVIAGSPALWWPGENGQVSGAGVAAAYAGHTPAGRLFLDAGTEEGGLLADARAFRATLAEAGHDVVYREFRGGHDHACWRGSLAGGIVAVLS
jgi:enterochelin esterase-like enzyme